MNVVRQTARSVHLRTLSARIIVGTLQNDARDRSTRGARRDGPARRTRWIRTHREEGDERIRTAGSIARAERRPVAHVYERFAK
jgi:hypothetical protein